MSTMRLTMCSGIYAHVRTYSSSLGVIILLVPFKNLFYINFEQIPKRFLENYPLVIHNLTFIKSGRNTPFFESGDESPRVEGTKND
jgi:hypothetical protein